MNIMELLNFSHECRHENFSADREIGYCPDCGELIENQWYILRCSCCGVKHRAIVKHGKIVPIGKFCENCGGHDFVAERIDKINFIDINYAVLVKAVVTNDVQPFTQCWVDVTETPGYRQRLLPQYQ